MVKGGQDLQVYTMRDIKEDFKGGVYPVKGELSHNMKLKSLVLCLSLSFDAKCKSKIVCPSFWRSYEILLTL